jgi:hypothetical protein
MTTFLATWTLCAICSFLWVILAEMVVAKRRGASYMSGIRKRLSDVTPLGFGAICASVFFLWWFMLLLWIWAALKGRTYLEHIAHLKEKDAEEKRRVETLRKRVQAQVLLVWIKAKGFEAEISESEDGVVLIIKGSDGQKYTIELQ